MSDSPSLPDYVINYLQLNKQLCDLKDKEKEIRSCIDKIQPIVGTWLQSVPQYEISLDFIGEEAQYLGSKGKLRFVVDKRKEYLGKNSLFAYLYSFFCTVYADKDVDNVRDLANAAVNHIWQSRKTTKNCPVITRTFSKKRKKPDTTKSD